MGDGVRSDNEFELEASDAGSALDWTGALCRGGLLWNMSSWVSMGELDSLICCRGS